MRLHSQKSDAGAPDLARSFSILLAPPAPAAIAFSIIAFLSEEGIAPRRVLALFTAIMFSGGIQIAYVLYLKRKGRVDDYDVPERLQRTGPYLLSAVLSAIGLTILYLLLSPDWMLALMWCYASNTLILALINRFWKISAHMMGLTGPLTALAIPTGFWSLAGIPLVVLLGYARVRLRAHTLAQVIAGAVAGAVLTAAQLFVWFSYVQGLLPPI